jgi:hypothetical protein
MALRPGFNEIKSYDEFIKYYWYREELSKICRDLEISKTGNKQELNDNIKEYFRGNFVKKRKEIASRKNPKETTLESPLLKCGFSFNADFRKHFSNITGEKNFKFSADMAAAWRKVKRTNDLSFTIQDMLDVYYRKSDYAKYDSSSCQWNQFLKDFCADEGNFIYKNKLHAAAMLWKIVKESTDPKIYTKKLVQDNLNRLQGL